MGGEVKAARVTRRSLGGDLFVMPSAGAFDQHCGARNSENPRERVLSDPCRTSSSHVPGEIASRTYSAIVAMPYSLQECWSAR